jgi:Domain of unknown function (DUF6779)
MPRADLPSEPAPRRSNRRGAGRTLLGAALVLAVLGAAALALTSDPRWLRLGIVAALWAALAGAFAAARYRRDATVAARREHALEVETETAIRRRMAQEVRNEVRGELDGLRTELRILRQTLDAVLGSQVLVERVALRAEPARLRSLPDQSRTARSAERALPQGRPPDSAHQPRHRYRWNDG